MKKRLVLNITLWFFIISLMIGATFAWITWKGRSASLKLTIGSVDTVRITFYPYILEGEIVPVGTYADGIKLTSTVANNKSEDTIISLYFNISSIDAELQSTSLKYVISKEISSNVTTTNYASGTFANASTAERMYILTDTIPANTAYEYSVYIYIDNQEGDSSNLIDKSLFLEFRGIIEQTNTLVDFVKQSYSTNKDTIYTISHDEITSDNSGSGNAIPASTDYRYYGKNPNNYICLDYGRSDTCEDNNLYRIIGVMYDELSGKEKVKVIKANSISSSSYTNDVSSYLNGLTSTAKNTLSLSRFYIAGYSAATYGANIFYEKERGTTIPSGTADKYYDDLFGLMYPSDYGYASGSICSAINLSMFSDTCISNNWINNSSNQWTITPNTSSSGRYFYVSTLGKLASNTNTNEYTIRPTTYLNQYVYVIGGLGTVNNPYKIETRMEPSVPVLDDGMIPIVFDTTGSNTVVKTISSDDSNWYDYNDKKWANVALVKETGVNTRTYYKENPNVEIDESDILGYFVWIPRYKYQIWTTGVSSNGSEQEIKILFESKIMAKSEVSDATQVGDYYTHPAFTFGNIELDGIWVGKFETTGDATTPTVLPDLSALRNQTMLVQFQTALKFTGRTFNNNTGVISVSGSGKGNIYGLSAGTTDSHMMKNSEWGAVAYLSHSKYGINEEIYINNSEGFYTGRSGGNVGGMAKVLHQQFPGGSTSTSRSNTYGYYTWDSKAIAVDGVVGSYTSDRTLGEKASTTGNIYGIYDMSGGAIEYVMGNYNDSVGTSGFVTFPDNKYYNKYLITDINSCTISICGGHALNETHNWYKDDKVFFTSKYVFMERGGTWESQSNAGAFEFDTYSRGSGTGGAYTFRMVLISEIS